MEGRGGHARLALGIALLALASLVALVLALGGGGEDDPLRVERSLGPGPTEVLVYVEPDVNEPGTAGGRNAVDLRCVDGRGRVVVRGRLPWPFTDTDDGIADPHGHQPALPDEVRKASRCRLGGTDLGEAEVTDAPLR